MSKVKTFRELAKRKGYQIRHYKQPLKDNEDFNKVMLPFIFSTIHGGTVDSIKFYNDYYLYPIS